MLSSYEATMLRTAARTKAVAKVELPEACSLGEAADVLQVKRSTLSDLVTRMDPPTAPLRHSSRGRRIEQAELVLLRCLLTPAGARAAMAAMANMTPLSGQ